MNPINIQIAADISNHFIGYELFLATYNKLKSVKNQRIVFDFSNNKRLEANLCAIFGALIEMIQSNNNTFEFKNVSNSLYQLFDRNGFLALLDKAQIFEPHINMLTYQKYKPNDDGIFKDYIAKQLLLKPDFPQHSEKLGKKIIESIFEIYENARTHGKCNYIHVCGQYFPEKEDKPLHITIVDRGNSIRKNVNDYYKNNFQEFKTISGKNAIEWAMYIGNTTKIGVPGGLGLNIIFEFVKLNKGKIQIISSNGFWEYNDGKITLKTFQHAFVGTIVNIKFNLNDKNRYYLTEEQTENFSLDDLF